MTATAARRKTRTVWREVEVRIEMDDLDTDDMIEELQARGYTCTKGDTPGPDDPFMRLADAYHYQPDPMPIVRELVYEHTGRLI